MIQMRWRDGRLQWRWMPPAWPCRIGLHFMVYYFALDGYRCPCGRRHLWQEEIRHTS